MPAGRLSKQYNMLSVDKRLSLHVPDRRLQIRCRRQTGFGIVAGSVGMILIALGIRAIRNAKAPPRHKQHRNTHFRKHIGLSDVICIGRNLGSLRYQSRSSVRHDHGGKRAFPRRLINHRIQ